MKKKVCIFGGAGFLGSHVAEKLHYSGYDVTIFDVKKSRWLKDGQKMILGDILDLKSVEEAVKDSFAVYNFSAIADLGIAREKPLDVASINILGNVNLLEASKNAGVNRFIFASSVYVHSREGGFYRCSKLASEQFVEEYQRTFGLNFTILRYGSLYGPRSGIENNLRKIITRALLTGKVSYQGRMGAKREYIHVADAAEASVHLLDERFKNQHIVLTGQESMLVYDLLKMIAEILGIKGEVEISDELNSGHYILTPYSYQTSLGKKYTLPLHYDLGQGLLELIHEIQMDIKK